MHKVLRPTIESWGNVVLLQYRRSCYKLALIVNESTWKSHGAKQLEDHHSTERAHARNRRAVIYYGTYVS